MCIYKRKICVYYVIWCAYSHLPLQAYYFCMLRPSARRGKHSAEGQLNSSNVIASDSVAIPDYASQRCLSLRPVQSGIASYLAMTLGEGLLVTTSHYSNIF
jgi:hypothetical protein